MAANCCLVFLKCKIMRVRYFLLVVVSLLALAGAQAQVYVPAPSPSAMAVDVDGNETELAFGDEYSGEAPLVVRFFAGAAEVEGYSLVCSWEFTREGESVPFLTRYDADIEYDFRESGTVIVQPKIVYTSMSNPEVVWEFGSLDYEPFRIILAESKIDVPNAFSPNGDGINDYFNVYNVKSIVEFNASIYNRWGQQLYSWGIDEIDCETCGWDGTYKGTPVKDGVYFVVVTARGADGVRYEIRRDVNLLRGFTENVANP